MSNIIMKDIIKIRKSELNITYEEIGDIVGVTKSTVRKWATGDIKNIRQDKILLLANALQISPTYLMGWEEGFQDPNYDLLKTLSKLTNSQILKVLDYANCILLQEQD